MEHDNNIKERTDVLKIIYIDCSIGYIGHMLDKWKILLLLMYIHVKFVCLFKKNYIFRTMKISIAKTFS